jgi:anti-sigma regulatory factor (Ser/Thr protein kinase)
VVNGDDFSFSAKDASLACDARSLAIAFLQRVCETGSDWFSAELIVGELLSNVLEHAPGAVTVSIRRNVDDAVLEVGDAGEGYRINAELPDDFAESHRGLFIVATLGRNLRTFRRDGHSITSVVLPVAYKRSERGEMTHRHVHESPFATLRGCRSSSE